MPTFLFVGRLAANKRPDHAVEAFRIIKDELPRRAFGSSGTGPLEEELARTLPEDATLLGRVPREELYARMATAHCLLMPSVREGWGMVVVEANSVGTPAVGYDVGGIRDSIRNGRTGLLATAGDPLGLATHAISLVTDEALRGHPVGGDRLGLQVLLGADGRPAHGARSQYPSRHDAARAPASGDAGGVRTWRRMTSPRIRKPIGTSTRRGFLRCSSRP